MYIIIIIIRGENSNTAECVCVFSFGRNISTFYILFEVPFNC